jgi:transposase
MLICDNAKWHKKKSLTWGVFTPKYLPPYSPDLNPIERLWLLMKAQWFTDFSAKNKIALIDRLDKALLWIINRTTQNKITCSIKTSI